MLNRCRVLFIISACFNLQYAVLACPIRLLYAETCLLFCKTGSVYTFSLAHVESSLALANYWIPGIRRQLGFLPESQLMGTQPATLPLEFHKFQVHNTAARYVVLEHYRVHAKTSIRLKDLIMVFADQNVHVNTDRSLEATTTALKSQA
jgi:hypothetical protein